MCDDAEQALLAWSWPGKATLRANRDGLINRTFVVDVGGDAVAVLQQLNTKIFVPEVHEDIEAVTQRLRAHGVATPLLRRTLAGALWHDAEDGGVWRCLTHEGDRTIHKVQQLSDARSAGTLAARFHSAVQDLAWEFRSVRAGAHDTTRHMEGLSAALEAHQAHRLFDEVAPIALDILGRWEACDQGPTLPRRVIHGDLKISNVRFLGDAAHCLIDLDTMARDTLGVELGDAMRSWCNPASEDTQDTQFDINVFAAAMDGYATGSKGSRGPSVEEWDAVVPGIERIALELAARFARDALEESYFGWNARFGSRGEHNLVRARGQLALARSVRSRRGDAERVIASAKVRS